jgi:arginine-tRNA-protein transferase
MHDDGAFLSWLERQELPRTPLYDCPYLPARSARQYGFAAETLPPELYHDLMDRGYRRSGQVFYAMDCPDCRRCVPLRVATDTFRPSRSQRRVLRRNRDVTVRFGVPEFTSASFELYRRYLHAQHPGTPQSDEEHEFRASFYDRVVDTLEARYFVDERLVGVSLLDCSSRSWSSVYHFFDPDERHRSIGVHSVLVEIAEAARRGVPHYYLGFWVEGAATMHYKADYRPHELLVDGVWIRDERRHDAAATDGSDNVPN